MKVTVTSPIVHLCPFKDEVDVGAIELLWNDDEMTVELHSLRAHIDGYADQTISHEGLTNRIAAVYAPAQVTTRWTTAGMEVTCSST